MLKDLKYLTILNDDVSKEEAFELFKVSELYDETKRYLFLTEQDTLGYVVYEIIHF